MPRVKKVLVAFGVERTYDYLAPPQGVAPPQGAAPPQGGAPAGALVRVPFGPRRLVGAVWGEGEASLPTARLKTLEVLDLPPLAEAQRRFVDWMARYVMAPRGQILRQALNVPSLWQRAPPRRAAWYRLGKEDGARLSSGQAALMRTLAAEGARPITAQTLCAHANVSAAVLRRAAARGLVEAVAPPPPPPPSPQFAGAVPPPPWRLSAEQAPAAEALTAALARRRFETHVLDGVTGSGKTAVYFEALAALVPQGGQGVVLLPEISLTEQFVQRFEERFGVAPALWHSGLSEAERRAVWLGVGAGRIQLVVGARSALFLPWQNLRALIVDEEHDVGFKQEQMLLYHARDMAVAYASMAGALAVLSSASLSLETVHNIQRQRYRVHRLPHRIGAARLPHLVPIDLRAEPPPKGEYLSPVLRQAMEESLGRGEQVLLFLNRRGFAPMTLCRACGQAVACPHCDAWLVEHRAGPRRGLLCHHCGHRAPPRAVCAACGAEDAMVACGPGVERIAAEAAALFPRARTLTLSSDLRQQWHNVQRLWQEIAEGSADILVGTQIMSKGHHFPKLRLVGVVDADWGLGAADLRAAERSWQILQQVAGRAGRVASAEPARAFLQTHQPDHPVLRALIEQDRDAFVQRELAARRAAGLPPYGRLAALILSGPRAAPLEAFARRMSKARPAARTIHVYGPAPAPFYRLRQNYRLRFLLVAAGEQRLQPYIAAWRAQLDVPSSLRLVVDIDPYSFL